VENTKIQLFQAIVKIKAIFEAREYSLSLACLQFAVLRGIVSLSQ